MRKCNGYTPNIFGDIYSSFPFQLMNEISYAKLLLTLENGVFHHIDCLENDYMIFSISFGQPSNSCCINLEWNTSFKKLIDRSNINIDDSYISTLNNKFLTHSQLANKVKSCQSKKRELRLHLLNKTFRDSKLCGTFW